MGKAVVILAGQSNALRAAPQVRSALDSQYGAGNYVLVEAFAGGAPLLYARSPGLDWASPEELPATLAAATIAALRDNPGSYAAGFLWLQGEADSRSTAVNTAYEAAFTALFEATRAAVAGALGPAVVGIETAPVVIAELSDHAPGAPERAHWEDVTAAHRRLAERDGRVTTIDPDSVASAHGMDAAAMFTDTLHYAPAFRAALAEAMVARLAERGAAAGCLREGSAGADTFSALPSADEMAGFAGNDRYFVDSPGDRVREAAGEGHDRVYASVSFALSQHSQHLEELFLTGSADLAGIGNGLDNVIRGNAGDNFLNGAHGDDRLYGGDGNDTFRDLLGSNYMAGGRGDDVYAVTSPGDRVVEERGEGLDRVVSTLSFSLRDHSQHIEILVLAGSADIDATGNAGANILRGNSGDNLLDGAAGDDRLFGGDGNDRFRDIGGRNWLEGGRGDDLYWVLSPRDIVVEQAGEGLDRVFSPVGFTLPGHVEILALTGAADASATGNDTANVIRGNDGANLLDGGAGNDRLFGGAGDDTLLGGAGDDWLEGGAGADVFIFREGEGRDVIADFDPAAPGERIDLSALSAITGFDDLLAGHMSALAAGVLIDDGAGSSILLAGLGADALSADDFLF
ncbi:hypothetical protein [Oceanicella sp. SM1341]|uniref:hypothetical protein n=1 Tax=Oceanicella sp. SM1341 TaxID=1548889 RepID=UPI0018E53130|nr:hypothetical protein [Oceanicella sp. SM1341]